MNIEFLALIVLILGLLLIYLFPFYTNVKQCNGMVKYEGPVLKVFISKKGNRIAVLDGALAIVPEWVEKGERVVIIGRGSKSKSTCFIFPEEIRYVGD